MCDENKVLGLMLELVTFIETNRNKINEETEEYLKKRTAFKKKLEKHYIIKNEQTKIYFTDLVEMYHTIVLANHMLLMDDEASIIDLYMLFSKNLNIDYELYGVTFGVSLIRQYCRLYELIKEDQILESNFKHFIDLTEFN